jgi:hypothetical protein
MGDICTDIIVISQLYFFPQGMRRGLISYTIKVLQMFVNSSPSLEVLGT